MGKRPHQGRGVLPRRGILELSGSSKTPSTEKVSLWLQVREVHVVWRELEDAGVDIIEPPIDKPWGLRLMRVEDPDGVRLVIVEVPKDHPLRRP